MGLGYALATATLFQSFIKWFIGGLRPHFLTVCRPLSPPPLSVLGAAGHAVWYTAVVCTGDAKQVKEAQMSFPSGHSSAAFAGFGFLALYLNGKLKVVGRRPHGARGEDGVEGAQGVYVPRSKEETCEDVHVDAGRRVSHWKVVVWVLPWLFAFLMAASKVRDCWHHPVDVLFGSLVGILFAHLAYWCVFRGVYDGRVNHIPRR